MLKRFFHLQLVDNQGNIVYKSPDLVSENPPWFEIKEGLEGSVYIKVLDSLILEAWDGKNH